MKKLLALLVLSTSLFSVSFSQNTELGIIQKMYGVEKRALVTDFMKLDDSQKDAFWDVYEAYETERKALGAQRVALLEKYAEQYDTLTEEQTDADMKEALVMSLNREKLRKKYYAKMKKATSAKTAAKFIQLETYLSTAIRFQILDNIPFVGEMDK